MHSRSITRSWTRQTCYLLKMVLKDLIKKIRHIIYGISYCFILDFTFCELLTMEKYLFS